MNLKELVTKKEGPLPIWGWAAVGGVAWFIFRRLHPSSSSSSTNGSIVSPQPVYTGTSSGANGTGSSSGGGIINPPLQCPPGSTADPTNSFCIPNITIGACTQLCAQGTTPAPWPVCCEPISTPPPVQTPGNNQCPPGTSRLPDGTCGTTIGTQGGCPPGTIWTGTSCIQSGGGMVPQLPQGTPAPPFTPSPNPVGNGGQGLPIGGPASGPGPGIEWINGVGWWHVSPL